MSRDSGSQVLLKLLNGSLLLVSIQGVVSGAATLLCGSPLGHWVDRHALKSLTMLDFSPLRTSCQFQLTNAFARHIFPSLFEVIMN